MTRRAPLRGIPGLRLSLTAALVVLIVGTGTLAGHAYWTTTATAPLAATTATVSTTATGAASLATKYQNGITAVNGSGQSVAVVAGVLNRTAAVTVANTGKAPLTYSLAVTGGTSSYNGGIALQVWKQLSSSCATVPSSGVGTGTLAAPPAIAAASATLALSTSAVFCLRTSVTGVSAAATLTTTPSIAFVGAVGTNWTARSTATAFTQAEAVASLQIKHAGSGKCLDAATGAVYEPIGVQTCATASSTNSQSFRLAAVSSLGTGYYRITAGVSTGSPIPTAGVNGNNMRLIPTVADDASGAAQQQWRLIQQGTTGTFQIKNMTAGTCVSLFGTADGNLATMNTCGTSTSTTDSAYIAQHFSFVAIP
jgi:hypothetical protein